MNLLNFRKSSKAGNNRLSGGSLRRICGFGLAIFTVSTAYADSRTWTGGHISGGAWSLPANWGGTAPVAGDSLVFAGSVRLSATNNFSGGTTFDGITFASDAEAFTLTGNGLYTTGDIVNNSTVLQTLTTFSGNGITLSGGDRTFHAASGDLLFATTVSVGPNTLITETGLGRTVTINGAIQIGGQGGSGGLFVTGEGTTALGGVNTYTGATTINSGTLSISSGDNLQATSSVIFASDTESTLHIAGENVVVTRNISQTGLGNYEVSVDKTLTLSGTVSGAGDLNLKGNGTLALTGTNTFTGATIINTGTIAINSSASLQSTSSILFGGLTSTLHATADGINLDRNIQQVSRGNYVVDAGNTLTISGTISGIGQLHKNGDGLVILDAANTYTGRTVVNSGTLRLGSGGNITNANMDILGGVLDLNGKNLSLSDTLTVGLGASSGTVLSSDGTSTFSVGNQVLARSGTIAVNLTGNASLSKTGNGTVVLTGSNTYAGATSVMSGTLVVDGSIASDVTVSGPGVFGGSGIVNGSLTVQSGGALRPGNSPGILTSGDFTLELGGTYSIELAGTTLGVGGYDSLVVNGAVSLAGDLEIDLSFTPDVGSIFFIVQNDGGDAITGTFNGLAQDEIFLVAGQYFRISYTADQSNGTLLGGNDVALEAVPEPGVWGLLGLGTAYLMLRRRKQLI